MAQRFDRAATGAVFRVAHREITTRLRSRAFVIGTVATLLLIGAYAALTAFADGKEASSTVAFTPRTAPLAATTRAVAQSLDQQVRTTGAPDRAAAEARLRAGDVDAVVTGSPTAPTVLVVSDLGGGLHRVLDVVAGRAVLDAQLAALHADPAAVEQRVAGAHVTVRTLEEGTSDHASRLGMGITAAVLLYMSLTVYGQMVAQGVVEEKANRVVELLLPVVRPWQLMLGKVLGIAAVGLLQLVVFMSVGLAAAVGPGGLDLPASAALGTAVWAVVWYVLGFLVYALLSAGAAALVSRQEEVGNTVGPVLMLLFVPLALGSVLLPKDPHSPLVAAMSLVPLFAPVLFPLREAVGAVPLWQEVTATSLGVLTVPALVWAAGRVYQRGILHTGSRMRLAMALRASA
jgi:ABC-2 type transport system permease protein